MDLHDRVVQVHHRDLVDPGQHRRPAGQRAQEAGRDRVELTDVTERERPQEAAQRAGRVAGVERAAHAPMAQQGHVIDRVGPRSHPRDQAHHLQVRVRALVRRHPHVRRDQARQARRLRQRNHRHQPSRPDQARVIERRTHRGTGMG